MQQALSSAKYIPFLLAAAFNGFMIMCIFEINSDKNTAIDAIQKPLSLKQIPFSAIIFGAFSIISFTLIVYFFQNDLICIFPELSRIATIFDYLLCGFAFSFLFLCFIFVPKVIVSFRKVTREQTRRSRQQKLRDERAIQNLEKGEDTHGLN